MVQVVKTAGIYRQVKIDSSIYNVVSAGTFLSWLPLRDKSLVFVKEMICLANSHGEIWGGMMEGRNRADIKAGAHVLVVRKQDQRSGKLTEGNVKDILTKSPTHPHGIKVRMESGVVGRVKKILQ